MSGRTALITETSLRGSATLQLAAGLDGVVLDTLSWERGTDGHGRQGHSVARLSLSDARRYRVLLGEAIAVIDHLRCPACGGRHEVSLRTDA